MCYGMLCHYMGWYVGVYFRVFRVAYRAWERPCPRYPMGPAVMAVGVRVCKYYVCGGLYCMCMGVCELRVGGWKIE